MGCITSVSEKVSLNCVRKKEVRRYSNFTSNKSKVEVVYFWNKSPFVISGFYTVIRWSKWPIGLRRMSAAARLLRLWVRTPAGARMFVYSECFVLSGSGLWYELITRPEESYRMWCVVVCYLETP